ncbi:hypothetical protein BHE74_00044433 [Ensete ventricosum]|uniref:Uncharacterized protein n=1 Tax=Ensete ventricosum TaxID=4639 RepID=A0A426ZX72_ENSVE|nr:hypothetical protein B296_00037683 [Ensete ventricosum]RWW06548.1 hypothetical protein GW17_00030122 [Ensete ventricosum]RWW49413.1 hypothetical protein BHE74_00044433 [Ensete ventricosum]RZS11848.1 hypothetical protein BHM03_00043217 [Ensete ventricosum]
MVGWRLAATALLAIFLTVLKGGAFVAAEGEQTCSGIVPMKSRGEVVSITDFGGVGDGRTLNTAAFVSAVFHIEQRKVPEGSLLYIPAGVWLTEAFNLTSHMTLFLAEGAVIKATQVCYLGSYFSPVMSIAKINSSLNVCIEDCYISTGDDLVAVKSGWDEYGIAYARPSSGIIVRRLTGDHPDDRYDPNALPVVDGLTIKNVWGVRVQQPGSIQGIKNSPFTQICLSNVKLDAASPVGVSWACADVSGGALDVQPSPCAELTITNGMSFCTGAL